MTSELRDILTNRDFLVATAASCSVFSHHSAAPTGPCLSMTDGSPAKAWGTWTLPQQFGNRRFQFEFILATVDHAFLGAYFLTEFDLLVDPAKRQVL